ncbi:hypothetical protein [Thermococcus sp. MV11]|uniref:hypothetical protein n=1 Tax=Thermococcus sp. MV11 TaxID=1638267 RepID=UPI0014303565|nr:hypothetical protein [Thermococcus sp. MV11]NJE03196.1 hypothetical protein [Thermococcus sp. MV11]
MALLLITPLLLYGLLFLLPALYDKLPPKKADLVAVALYGFLLFPLSFYFTFVSAAMADTFGIYEHLPEAIAVLMVALVAATLFTILVSLPLLLIRKKREIKRLIVLLFMASFFFDLAIIIPAG